MEATLESLLDTNGKQEHIIEEQAKKLEEQAKKLGEQALEIKELKQQVKNQNDINEKQALRINDLEQQTRELKQQTSELVRHMGGLLVWRNKLALRRLLDQARDCFALDCKYKDWGDMVDKIGTEQARSEVLRTLEESPPCDWEPSLVPDIVSLVIQKGGVRAQGNAAAHDFEDNDILQAVEAMPEGRKRSLLTKLYHYICRD